MLQTSKPKTKRAPGAGRPFKPTICPYCQNETGGVKEFRYHVAQCIPRKLDVINGRIEQHKAKIENHKEEIRALEREHAKLSKR